MADALAIHFSTKRRVPVFASFVGNSTGSMLNWFIPLEAGEGYKIAFISRYTSKSEATSSVLLWNYALKWSGPSTSLLAAVVGMIMPSTLDNRIKWTVLAACVLALSPYLVVRLVLASGVTLKATNRILARIVSEQKAKALYNTISNVHESVRLFRKQNPRDYLALSISQVVGRLLGWVALYAACHLMGHPYSFGQCALIHAAVRSMVYVTSIIPARLGVSESAGFMLFEALGLAGSFGLLLIFALRLKSLVANGLTNVVGSLVTWLSSSSGVVKHKAS